MSAKAIHLFALIVLISIQPRALATGPDENTVVERPSKDDPLISEEQFEAQYLELMKDLDHQIAKTEAKVRK